MNISNHWVVNTLLFTTLGFSSLVHAVPVSGQGTWETTLEGRDLDGNAATYEAYYDTVLGISWLANTAESTMDWYDASAWAESLNVYGVTGWRLPEMANSNASCVWTYGGTTCGYNVDTSTSEFASLFYDTLGNLADYDTTGTLQSGSGTSNTGPFSILGTEYVLVTDRAWVFDLGASTSQGVLAKNNSYDPGLRGFYAWAVRDGDVSAVPVPTAVWLFGSGLVGLIGIARRKKAA